MILYENSCHRRGDPLGRNGPLGRNDPQKATPWRKCGRHLIAMGLNDTMLQKSGYPQAISKPILPLS